MKAKKRKLISIIRTEAQLLKLMRSKNHWKSDYCDICFCISKHSNMRRHLNKFYFVGTCIDRRLMFKLLKENRVKYLVRDMKDTTEFLMQLALGTLTDDVYFYHVKRGIWRGGNQYNVEK
jgi:oligoribonuclease NrnB/cAMP/cGMP phosphodiesterase (DHH superfamily)